VAERRADEADRPGAAGHGDLLSGDVGRLVGGQEHSGVADFLGLSPALQGQHLLGLVVETVDPQAEQRALELAGCYVIVSDVSKDQLAAQAVHDSYVALQKVERDFRTMKTGLLQVRPVFVRKDSRTRGHVLCCMLALKLHRELERRLATAFGTTDEDPHAVTVADALAALNRLCLLVYEVEVIHKSGTDKDAQQEKKDKTTVMRLPKPSEHQRRILDALRVSFPMKL